MLFPLKCRSICWKPGRRRKPRYISELQDDCITKVMCTREKICYFTIQQITPSEEKEVLMLLYKGLHRLSQKNEFKVEQNQRRVTVAARGTKSLSYCKCIVMLT